MKIWSKSGWSSANWQEKLLISLFLAYLHAAIVSKSLLMATCYYPVAVGVTASTVCSAVTHHSLFCTRCGSFPVDQPEEVLACFIFKMYRMSENMLSNVIETSVCHAEENHYFVKYACIGMYMLWPMRSPRQRWNMNGSLCLIQDGIWLSRSKNVCKFLSFCPCCVWTCLADSPNGSVFFSGLRYLCETW